MLKAFALALAIVPFGLFTDTASAGHRGGGCGEASAPCVTATAPAASVPTTAQAPNTARRSFSYVPESSVMRAPAYRSYRSSGSSFGDAGAKMRGDFGR